MMRQRGPRGDIDRARILRAAETLLTARGTIDGISLRGVAAEVGVAVNALYTYFPSLAAVWHDLADERLGRLRPTEVLAYSCRHCALRELARRGLEVTREPGTLSLLRSAPVLGRHSFGLSETIMTLTEESSIGSRDAHDLIMGWFYGSLILDSDGWAVGTDKIRASQHLDEFPRIANREPADRGAQLEALLHGIGIACTAESAP